MLDKSIIESIEKMIVNGNRLELPKGQFTNYAQVKKVLLQAGGTYSNCGFNYKTDPQAIKDRLTGGEKIDDKKKFQQFFTPDALAVQLVELAEVETHHIFLEPSVGQAAIAGIVNDIGCLCTIVDLDPLNIAWLIEDGWDPIEGDFLGMTQEDLGDFDRIIANPPFTKNQDIDHIEHMYTFLKPGGIMVSLASPSWLHGSQKKQVTFRDWLRAVDAEITNLPTGTFKESGTMIAPTIIKIIKAD